MEDIYNETGNSNLEFFKGDLSLMRDVNQLADDITKAHSKIDVLINNAGVYEPMRKETVSKCIVLYGISTMCMLSRVDTCHLNLVATCVYVIALIECVSCRCFFVQYLDS